MSHTLYTLCMNPEFVKDEKVCKTLISIKEAADTISDEELEASGKWSMERISLYRKALFNLTNVLKEKFNVVNVRHSKYSIKRQIDDCFYDLLHARYEVESFIKLVNMLDEQSVIIKRSKIRLKSISKKINAITKEKLIKHNLLKEIRLFEQAKLRFLSYNIYDIVL